MRLILLRAAVKVLREWRFFNLPTQREERFLKRWKRVLDAAANLLWKILSAAAMVFEVKRRRESRPGRRA